MKSFDWRPSASIDILRQRAALIAKIRQFYVERGYLEVETPIMARHGVSDVYLTNIKAAFRGQDYCLQTSPEYHMKRLLAAGSGSIFQLTKVFRDDELGSWHNPEFTMLEWYQLHVDHHTLIAEIDQLLQLILQCPPLIKKTYQQVFLETCGIDPFTASLPQLQQVLCHYGLAKVLAEQEQDRDQYLFLLMSHVIEPAMAKFASPVAVYNFPSSQAALAQVKEGVAERFEIYVAGIELVNGFHELTDASVQLERFKQDNLLRQQKGLNAAAPDQYLLQALTHGLPSCSGAALGIDRLIMLALNQPKIAKVLAFDISRA